MKLVVDNYERDRITLKEEFYKSFCVEGDTMTDCFKRMYESERAARYCNGTSYRFRDENIQKAYKEWKQHGVTFEMYYGNATVD